MTTHTLHAWRDLLEIACARQTVAFDLVCESVELHGPTHRITATAYAHWITASEQHEQSERDYQKWLRERNCVDFFQRLWRENADPIGYLP